MRMAKASFEDIEGALNLSCIMDAIGRGWYPTISDDANVDIPTFFDDSNVEHLQHLQNLLSEIAEKHPGGMFRVVMGMDTILRNNILDPDKDYLDLHSRFASMEQENERLRAALSGIIGTSSPEELKGMEAALRQLPAPAQDKAAMIDAIHALLNTSASAEVSHG